MFIHKAQYIYIYASRSFAIFPHQNSKTAEFCLHQHHETPHHGTSRPEREGFCWLLSAPGHLQKINLKVWCFHKTASSIQQKTGINQPFHRSIAAIASSFHQFEGEKPKCHSKPSPNLVRLLVWVTQAYHSNQPLGSTGRS